MPPVEVEVTLYVDVIRADMRSNGLAELASAFGRLEAKSDTGSTHTFSMTYDSKKKTEYMSMSWKRYTVWVKRQLSCPENAVVSCVNFPKPVQSKKMNNFFKDHLRAHLGAA